jgi:ribosomal protein S18 acetylase RimI-like enzyme
MMEFSIRQLREEDGQAYRAVRLEALRAHPQAFAASYEADVQKPQSYFTDLLGKQTLFGAFDSDGELLGINAFKQEDGDKQRHRGWLFQMYVRPEMRGTGCALALVQSHLQHASQHVIQVHLGVAANNGPAIRLYQKAGFEIYGTEPRYLLVDGRYVDEHLMVRFLDEAPERDTNERQ